MNSALLMHFSHKCGRPSLSGNDHVKPLLETERQRLRNVFMEWLDFVELWDSGGQGRQRDEWEGLRKSCTGDSIGKGYPTEPRQHQCHAGHRGVKEESQTQHWPFGIEKGMKEREVGKEIKEESRKRQQERRKQRS